MMLRVWVIMVLLLAVSAAADEGSLEAVFGLLDEGKPEAAFQLASRFAEAGDAQCALYVGKAHLQGVGVESDLPKAVAAMFQARGMGSMEADGFIEEFRARVLDEGASESMRNVVLETLGSSLKRRGEIPLGQYQFRRGLRDTATLDALVEEVLALQLLSGRCLAAWGEEKRSSNSLSGDAIKVMERLHREGWTLASYIVARWKSKGIGGQKDLNVALTILAGLEDEESQQYRVSLLASEGRTAEAIKLLKRLAGEGMGFACRRYGLLLKNQGELKMAASYLEKAVGKNARDWEAVVHFAEMLVEGEGMAMDQARGLQLYEKAAVDGDHAIASYVAGMMYLKGVGTSPSASKATLHLRKALALGVGDAREPLAALVGVVETPNVKRPVKVKPAAGSDMPVVEKRRPRVHIVKRGDTFYELARDYGVKFERFLDANPAIDPERLQIGQRLKLP